MLSVKSLPCKKCRYRWAVLGVVMMMLFGLFGCSSKQTPQQAAQRYLERKYGTTFVVEELTKKGNGPFKTEDYSGHAYETGKPLESFSVWVSGDKKTVYDARYALQLRPSLESWVQEKAGQVWSGVKAAAILDVIRYNPEADYGPEEFERFLKEESAECIIYLVLESGQLTAASYSEFDGLIKQSLFGSVLVFELSETEYHDTAVEDLLHAQPDVRIRIGADKETMDKEIRKLRGE